MFYCWCKGSRAISFRWISADPNWLCKWSHKMWELILFWALNRILFHLFRVLGLIVDILHYLHNMCHFLKHYLVLRTLCKIYLKFCTIFVLFEFEILFQISEVKRNALIVHCGLFLLEIFELFDYKLFGLFPWFFHVMQFLFKCYFWASYTIFSPWIWSSAHWTSQGCWLAIIFIEQDTSSRWEDWRMPPHARGLW